MKADTICITSRAKNKNKDSHIQGHCTKTHSWKSKRLCSLIRPEYKLIKDLVHHILSRCDVHNGLSHVNELFDQIFMLLGAIAHQEASLHGMELVPCLDLRRGQHHRRAMTNAVEGDLLSTGQDVLEASIDEEAPGIDGVYGYVHRQLERLQLRYQGQRSQKQESCQHKRQWKSK